MQLLQRIQTLTDAPEGKTSIKSRGVKTFEFQDQGQFNLICLLENMQQSSVSSEGQYSIKNVIFRQNKKNIHIFILFKIFQVRFSAFSHP